MFAHITNLTNYYIVIVYCAMLASEGDLYEVHAYSWTSPVCC